MVLTRRELRGRLQIALTDTSHFPGGARTNPHCRLGSCAFKASAGL